MERYILAFVIALILNLSLSYCTSAGAETKQTYDNRMTLGQFMYFNGNLEGAINCFRTALRMRPDSEEAHLNLLNLYVQKGELDKAIEECHETLRVKPRNREVHLALANLLRTQNRYDEAVHAIEEGEKCGANKAQCENTIALIHLQKGENDPALEHITRAVEGQHHFPDAHFIRGILLFKHGKKKEALEEIDLAIKQKQKFPEAHTTKGDILSNDGKWREAFDEYKKALSEEPKSAQAHVGLGNVYLQAGGPEGKGDYERAQSHYNQARDINPNDKNILYGLAAALEKKGEKTSAASEFSNALLLESDPMLRAQIRLHIEELKKDNFFDIGTIAGASPSDSASSTSWKAGQLDTNSPVFKQSFAELIKVKQPPKTEVADQI